MEARERLRERQAQQVRAEVLEAVIAQLEDRLIDDISVADIAAAAGVSLRTVYRHFPDRAALLHAAGEHLYGSLGVRYDIAGPDDVAPSFLDAARRLSERPTLARALVQTTAGRAARSGVRTQRVDSIRLALKPLTDDLDADIARRATAVIAHLCSAASWVSISDESGLNDDEAQQAVAWAIDTLISALRSGQKAARRRPSRS
jgi:AcrR family transcriptional regulator